MAWDGQGIGMAVDAEVLHEFKPFLDDVDQDAARRKVQVGCKTLSELQIFNSLLDLLAPMDCSCPGVSLPTNALELVTSCVSAVIAWCGWKGSTLE